MSDEQDEIRARYEAAMKARQFKLSFDTVGASSRDVDFALADIPRLLGEVERLTADNAAYKADLQRETNYRERMAQIADECIVLRAQLANAEAFRTAALAPMDCGHAYGYCYHDECDDVMDEVRVCLVCERKRLCGQLAERDAENLRWQQVFEVCRDLGMIYDDDDEQVDKVIEFIKTFFTHYNQVVELTRLNEGLTADIAVINSRLADREATAVSFAWEVFEFATCFVGCDRWRNVAEYKTETMNSHTVEQAIAFLLSRNLIEKHPERQWYRHKQTQSDFHGQVLETEAREG